MEIKMELSKLQKEIVNAKLFYGLSDVDSHMMKNSEWGAVSYLTWSKYGRNKTEKDIPRGYRKIHRGA